MMKELLIAWENGLLLPKLITVVILTIPVWGGIIAGIHHYFNYYLIEEQPKEVKRMKW